VGFIGHNINKWKKHFACRLGVVMVSVIILTACTQVFNQNANATPDRPLDASNPIDPLSETAVISLTLQAPTLVPTIFPTITSSPTVFFTATSTKPPPFLPSFSYKFSNPDVKPENYVSETCNYLEQRWGTEKSQPGTVVVPIMYHSVRNAGKPLIDNTSVSEEYFLETLDHAKALGFETITTEQLVGFLFHNDPIPPRSMILIIDDRRLGVVRDHFMPVLEKYDWTVTMAYITGVPPESEWQELEELYASGQLDIQAHGFLHNGSTYFTEWTEPEMIKQEIDDPVHVIQAHFGKKPLAFIWPGGNFTSPAIAQAHESGYKIGFTAYSRGALMYNWIPLGAEERKMDDPLMVLPRYWSTAAFINLDEAVQISKQAISFAADNQASEYEYYQKYCQGTLPRLTPVLEGN
jgi:peptidoglycan/xylan/chitin deacetylase (PgdA/CDA1 family)